MVGRFFARLVVAAVFLLAFALAAAVFVGYPLAVLWAANVFGAGVPYNLQTWAAVYILVSAVRGFRGGKSK